MLVSTVLWEHKQCCQITRKIKRLKTNVLDRELGDHLSIWEEDQYNIRPLWERIKNHMGDGWLDQFKVDDLLINDFNSERHLYFVVVRGVSFFWNK